jgi:hypothetical protein
MPIRPPFLRTCHLPFTLASLVAAAGPSRIEVCHGQVVSVENTGRASPDRLTSRQDHMQTFDREIRSFARLLNLPGMVVVVAEDGKVVQQLDRAVGEPRRIAGGIRFGPARADPSVLRDAIRPAHPVAGFELLMERTSQLKTP